LITGEFSGSVSGELSSYGSLGDLRDYIKLGNTGLDVSPIAIGETTYGEPDRGHPVWSLGEDDSRPLIRHALNAGSTSSTPRTCTRRAPARRSSAAR
jgi:hypothetical protein